MLTPMNEIHQLSPQAFAAFGVNALAYIKPVTTTDGRSGYAVFAADGTQLSAIASRDVALAAVRQNDMEPLSVH